MLKDGVYTIVVAGKKKKKGLLRHDEWRLDALWGIRKRGPEDEAARLLPEDGKWWNPHRRRVIQVQKDMECFSV
jgi:hypothetical protein